MYADVADYAEVKTGRRATGLIFSSATMAQKLGNTLANTLPLFALGAIGFIANDVTMTDATRHTVLAIFALFPLIGAVAAIVALCFYKIDEDMIRENSEKLAQMKAVK
jgi:GPH family glycoside/pentoside/hexuronide:cation symporter